MKRLAEVLSRVTIRQSIGVALSALVLSWAVAQEPAPAGPSSADDVDPLAAKLVLETQRVRAHAEKLAATRQQLDERRRAELEEVGRANDRAEELISRLAVIETGSLEATTLYDTAVEEVTASRARLREALAELHRPPGIPQLDAQVPVDRLTTPSLADGVQQLRELLAAAKAERSALVELERELRWTVFERWATTVERTNGLRVAAIDRLPPGRRARVLGYGREGVAQLRREAGQVELAVRTYLERIRHGVREVPGILRDVFTLGSVSWTVAKMIAVLAGYLWLRRRRDILRAFSRDVLLGKSRTGRPKGPAAATFDVLEVVAPWGGFLLFLVVLQWAAGPLARRTEFAVGARIATFYAGYRLAIDVLFAASVGLARRYRLRMDAGRLAAILRTVRTLMRVLFAILALRVVSEMLLGRGHLYHTVTRAAVAISLITAFVLLVRWRSVIADTYLARESGGSLARLVHTTRDRWYGLFVSAVAFVLLAVNALMRLVSDTAMSFEQTRRGLAFLFRRRVEKLAERAGYAEGHVDELPQDVVDAFCEEPVTEEELSLDRFPGREAFTAMRDSWRADDVGASFLLSGEKGMGKTTWLRHVDPVDLPYTVITLEGRILTNERLAATLSQALPLGLAEDADLSAVRKALNDGPKRIVAVDLTQNLFLSTVGGYATFESFAQLIEATCERVLWVCAMSAFAREHLFGVRPDLMVFRHHERLEGWSEEDLGALLLKRSAAAGIRVEYDALLDQRTYGTTDGQEPDEAEAGYTRLLWDYSDGNPRAALHFWVRSLVPVGERRFSVRLFRAPAADEIEALGSRAGFLLKAIVVHENLTLRELATTTRYPSPVCRMQLSRLEDLGVLRRGHTRYRLTTHWHRAVVRYLKRVNLVS